jgi:hypothetical protein
MGRMARSTMSLVTQQKSLREAVSFFPTRFGEDNAMIFFEREMGKHQGIARNENVLCLPTTHARVFFLAFLRVDVSTGGGG